MSSVHTLLKGPIVADIESPLQYGRLTGEFWSVVEDSSDPGDAPDTTPLMGSVVFTPSYRVLRVTSEDVTKRGVVYVDTVTAQVANGVLVDDFGAPGVSLLAATEEDGDVFPNDISWTAKFDLTMADGSALLAQPEPTKIQVGEGEEKSISDFLPPVLESGKNVSIVTVDRNTMRHVDDQVDYINTLVSQLAIAIEDGVVKGDTGAQGPRGDKGDVGSYGPPGSPGTVEIYNYVTNPVPTSNDGFRATNGTITYGSNAIKLTPTDRTKKSYMSWIEAVPSYPGTNMYLQFSGSTTNSAEVSSEIMFLNAELEPVDSYYLVHTNDPDLAAPPGVTSDGGRVYTNMYYTDGPASYAVFSVGLPANSPAGATLTASKFFFSPSIGFYFSGSDTLPGYITRWLGTENDSISSLIPQSVLDTVSVKSVNGQTGDITIDAVTLGLGQVENTTDADKPISDLTQAALDLKLDSSSLRGTVSALSSGGTDAYYLKEFDSFATQERWEGAETFVDIAYELAPLPNTSLVRVSIPGSTTGNSASSIPTVEVSADGETWAVWRELTTAPPGSVKYTDIDAAYDTFSGNLKVIVREESGSSIYLHLYTITPAGVVTDSVISTTTSTAPHFSPSIVESPARDGSLFLYSRTSSGGHTRRVISSDGTLGTAATNMVGLKSGAPLRVSKFYGTFVAASFDGSAANSPGILLSRDGITWVAKKGITSTHTWARGASARTMAVYPGVSRGRIGVFLEYVSTTGYKVSRLFLTSNPTLSGTVASLSTNPSTTTSAGGAVTFPGTLPSVPKVLVSSNDSKLNLGVVSPSVNGFTVERFNMSEAPSTNATISWTAIS